MADLYDIAVVEWAERQAGLLRRHAAGEKLNEQLDWEVETVGRNEMATRGPRRALS